MQKNLPLNAHISHRLRAIRDDCNDKILKNPFNLFICAFFIYFRVCQITDCDF